LPGRVEGAWPEGFAGGIAHRLDVGTSGALAVAADPAELAALREAFQSKQLVKTYRFVSRRSVPWDAGGCDRAIAHDRRRKRRMVVQRGAHTPHRGKWLAAETRFRRLEEGPHGTVWQATMSTGAMHQIRVHAAFVGLVLAGDPVYGGGEPVPGGAPFALHHVGFVGAGFATSPVPEPPWAVSR
jgi:23S rRNA-/tRNA-specific pseudouridylate synthase